MRVKTVCGCFLIQSLTMVSLLLATAAQADDLRQLFVPTSGHIEMQSASGILLENVNVTTIDDVIALRDKLNAGPLDEASVTSWKFLDRAGLAKAERPIPPPPQHPVGEITHLPDWRKLTFDFAGSERAFSLEIPEMQLRWDYVVGPKSCVEIESQHGRDVYKHFGRLSHGFNNELSVKKFFSREAGLFRYKFTVQPYDENELLTETFGSGVAREVLLVDREHDAILIRAKCLETTNRVLQFTLHLQLETQAEPQPHQMPSLTIEFLKSGGGWRCNSFWIEKAQWNVPFPPERFVVDVPAGESYFAKGVRGPIVRAGVIQDITSKMPSEVLKDLKFVP